MTLFYSWEFEPFDHLHPFHPLPTPSHATNNLLLSIMPSRFIYIVANVRISLFFYGWIFHCVYVCVSITSSLIIHPSSDTSVGSMPWLLQIMLLWTWGCIYIFEFMFGFLWMNTQKWNCWIILLFPIFSGNSILFSIVYALIHIPTNSGQGSLFIYILTNTCYFFPFWW